MAYTKNLSYRAPKSGVSSKYRQALFLIAAVIVGMIISASINAIPSLKSHAVAAEKVVTIENNIR